MHLDLALADAFEVPRAGLALHGRAKTRRVGTIGRHATVGRHEIIVLSVGVVEIGTRFGGGSDRGQGRVPTLSERSVSTGAVGHVGRGMSVVGRHGVPEGAPYSGDAVDEQLAWRAR